MVCTTLHTGGRASCLRSPAASVGSESIASHQAWARTHENPTDNRMASRAGLGRPKHWVAQAPLLVISSEQSDEDCCVGHHAGHLKTAEAEP